ncbi:hypothetical protein [Pseudomonas sp.]|uniref:hypothetical protein n=1 Tax=Pseudomonas sp. TaxID=306 RepID=UPI0025859748|nr:hypothetical protein [Pseudomonas sp.]
MNDELRAAVERLFAICLGVTLAGKHHAFMRYDGPWQTVEVDLHPADDDYAKAPKPLICDRVRLSEPMAIGHVKDLADRISVYLLEDAA